MCRRSVHSGRIAILRSKTKKLGPVNRGEDGEPIPYGLEANRHADGHRQEAERQDHRTERRNPLLKSASHEPIPDLAAGIAANMCAGHEIPHPPPSSGKLEQSRHGKCHKAQSRDAQDDSAVRNLLHLFRNRRKNLQCADNESDRNTPGCEPKQPIAPVSECVADNTNEVAVHGRRSTGFRRLPVVRDERKGEKNGQYKKRHADKLPEKPVFGRLELHVPLLRTFTLAHAHLPDILPVSPLSL